jgi:hypothetical protein
MWVHGADTGGRAVEVDGVARPKLTAGRDLA